MSYHIKLTSLSKIISDLSKQTYKLLTVIKEGPNYTKRVTFSDSLVKLYTSYLWLFYYGHIMFNNTPFLHMCDTFRQQSRHPNIGPCITWTVRKFTESLVWRTPIILCVYRKYSICHLIFWFSRRAHNSKMFPLIHIQIWPNWYCGQSHICNTGISNPSLAMSEWSIFFNLWLLLGVIWPFYCFRLEYA